MNNNSKYNNVSDLLEVYCRYAEYVRRLENILHSFSKEVFALTKFKSEFGIDMAQCESFPWALRVADKDERQAFENFVGNKIEDNYGNYCHVSLRYTDAGKGNGEILGVPQHMKFQAEFLSLPGLFERYTAVYEPDTLLKNAQFIIDGRHCVFYRKDCGDITLDKAFQSQDFAEQFRSVLNITAVQDGYDDVIKHEAAIIAESYASGYLHPLETIILNTLGRMAETSRSVLRHLYQNRDGFASAEADGLIPSAERFGDYMNIRNLLHHQNDTLTRFGYFIHNDNAHDSHEYFLTSYRKLCSGRLTDRAKAYVGVLDDLRPLVQRFHPNLLSREKNESNSKFIDRIKTFKNQQPEQTPIIELNYQYKNEKSQKLLKNLRKLFSDVRIIDNPEEVFDGLDEKLHAYDNLNFYQQTYQELEANMSFYCLTHGKNMVAMKAVNFLRENGIIDGQTVDKLKKFRELRNALSHQYFSSELTEKLQANMDDFIETTATVGKTIAEKTPESRWLKDAIFRFTHKDGKVVDVDFGHKKIVNIMFSRYNEKNGSPAKVQPSLSRKISRLKDGTVLDYDTRKIVFADKSSLYLNSDEHYCLVLRNATTKSTAKLLLDKNMAVKQYIAGGKSVPVSRGDVLRAVSAYTVMIDAKGRLSKYSYSDSSNVRKTVEFSAAGEHNVKLTDGTVLSLKNGLPEIRENNKISMPSAKKNGRE